MIPKKSKHYPVKRATVLPATLQKAWLKLALLLAVMQTTHVRRFHLMSSFQSSCEHKPEHPAVFVPEHGAGWTQCWTQCWTLGSPTGGRGILKSSQYQFQQDLCNESLNGKTCLFYSGMLYLVRYKKHWVYLKILIILRNRSESFGFLDCYLFFNCYS